MKISLISLFTCLNSVIGNIMDIKRTYNCVTFTIGQGTACVWMCDFCTSTLNTNNFYFTDNVCLYVPNEGGCVGTPIIGHSYTCCKI